MFPLVSHKMVPTPPQKKKEEKKTNEPCESSQISSTVRNPESWPKPATSSPIWAEHFQIPRSKSTTRGLNSDTQPLNQPKHPPKKNAKLNPAATQANTAALPGRAPWPPENSRAVVSGLICRLRARGSPVARSLPRSWSMAKRTWSRPRAKMSAGFGVSRGC